MGITLSGQAAGYHERNRVRPGLNLLRALVLNGMGHIDRVKIRTAQRTGLSAGGGLEDIGGNRYRRDAECFQSNRVVHTARRARPSIRQGLDDCLHSSPPQTLNHLRGCRFGESRLHLADHLTHCKILFQQ